MKKVTFTGILFVSLATILLSTNVYAKDSLDNDTSNIPNSSEINSTDSSSNNFVVQESTDQTIADSDNTSDSISSNPQKNKEKLSDDEYTNEKENALRAGYTIDQFEKIMNIPTFPSEDISIQKRSESMLTADQSKVVNMAKAQLGKPYVWGAKGPNSFDCSGLVQYVFSNAVNMNVSAPTMTQEKMGKEVSLNSLLPGDLLFYGDRGNTYHVGIYIGNNKMIHAPQPGQNVTTVDIQYFYPSFARRLLPEEVAQGSYIADGRYVTVTEKGYDLYSSFDWGKKDTTNNLINTTLEARGRYEHSNGSTYFSLYDSKGNWKGYLNASAVKIASGKQGVWLSNNQSVSIIKKDYPIWGNINTFTDKRDNTTNLYGKNFYAEGKYNHFSGATYLSLYDAQKNWIGYVNSEAATVKQSKITQNSKTVMINKEYKTIDTLPWGTLGFSKVSASPDYYGQVVDITQSCGSYIYSPDLNGWIDKKGTKDVIKTNHTTTIVNGGFSIDPEPWYEGITHSGHTNNYLNKTVLVNARSGSYYHVDKLGWIDKKAFNSETQKTVDAIKDSSTSNGKQLTMTEINRVAIVLGNGKSIDSLPWGTDGYNRIGSSNDFKGQSVTLTQDSGSYVYSPELRGWIDKKGLTIK